MAVLTTLLSGCAHRTTLTDAVRLYDAGREDRAIAACEEELARWETVDPAVTAALPEALDAIERATASDLLFLVDANEDSRPARPRDALRVEGLAAGGGPGGGLRAMAADLLSDAALRVLRAAKQAAALGERRLVPHLILTVYDHHALPGPAGPLAPWPSEVRVLAVKTVAMASLRSILRPAPETTPEPAEDSPGPPVLE